MGTTYIHGASRKYVIDLLTKPHHNGITLAKAVKSNVLWTVQQVNQDGSPHIVIGCYLLSRSQNGWGYKDMSEEMHPRKGINRSESK